MRFVAVAETSASVGATRARSEKVRHIAALLRALDPGEAGIAAGLLAGAPRQGRVGVGWATVFASVGPESVAAAEAGDEAPVANLEIADVDDALTRLAALSGPGSAGARGALLAELFGRATRVEVDFLRRLFVGELRQGALTSLVADAVAAASGVAPAVVRRALMLSGDLAHVAELASTGGAEAVAAVGLELGHPVLPMLASTSTDVAEAIATCGRSSVEWKLDGARIQVHRDGDEVHVFTRNGNDVTARLPGIVTWARSLGAGRFILDGEAVGWGDGEAPGLFQETMSRFARHDGVAGAALEARWFDCLHVDGDDLLDRPLHERAPVLDRLAGRWRVPGRVTDDVVEAGAVLEAALAAGHEGVMVKAADSTYEAGRRGGAWRKVKPVRTLDLVVLAVEWGQGRREGWLSNLHLGARQPDGGGFVMVGKTFKGLTDELLRWQTARFQELAVDERRGTVYVQPTQVVEIALDGVQRSTRYAGGVALRFARVRRYRHDKSATDADTIDAVRAMLAG